jgi:hypothetical protein
MEALGTREVWEEPLPKTGSFSTVQTARAANGDQPVGLYSPTVWEEGSSGSHLDDDNPALAGMVMLVLTDPGPYTRDLSEIELAILEDIGFSLTNPDIPSVLTLTIHRSGTSLTLSLSGGTGTYSLQTSTDLKSWEELATITITDADGRVDFELAVTGSSAYFTAIPE